MAFATDVARTLIPRPVRNWLRAPRRSLRWLGDGLLSALGRNRTLEIRPGWTLRCHPTAHRVFRAAQMRDPDQARELDAFLERCTPGMQFLDVGAHFGVFCFGALAHGTPGARAVAVEPSAMAVRVMRRTAALNGLSDRITVVQAAAGSAVGEQAMIEVGVLADGYLIGADDRPASEFTRVPATTVDALVTELGMRPTHLKIDVEGAETAVLEGARRTLSSESPPTVFLEVHAAILRTRNRDPADPLRMLEGHGYRLAGTDGAAIDSATPLPESPLRIVAELR